MPANELCSGCWIRDSEPFDWHHCGALRRKRIRASTAAEQTFGGRKDMRRKPKFRIGQVVRHRIEGGFYFKILRIEGVGYFGFKYQVLTGGKVEEYDESKLRALRKRERGQP